jgi:uncharacterized paraquat-inducible protein A
MADDVTFFDLFDPNQPRSDKEVIEQRLEICKVCPAFRPKSQTCSKCGCFMQLKATLTLAKCPIGKW